MKSIFFVFLFIPLVLLLLFTYLNVPSGAGVEVKGLTTKIVYIKSKYGNPYTQLVVQLEDMSTIEAIGPPHIPNRLQKNVILQKRSYFITGGDTYEFLKYE